MTDNNTKSNKLNTDNHNSIIPDSVDNTVSDPVDNTINNTNKSNPAKNGGTLVSLADRTLEERREIGRKGGLKSGETKKKRKTMRDTILSMLSQEVSPEKLEEMGVDISTLNGDYTMQAAVISAMFRQAVNGSEKAMQLLRDTIGEQPVNRSEVTQEIITKEDTDLMDSLKKSLIS